MTDTLLPPGSPILLNRFREFRYSVYRLETLQEYGNSGEDAALTAFLAGDSDPPPDPSDDEWAAMIGENVAAGRTVQRVHVIVEPLTDYMRFELTWAYGRNAAAGEDIRIIPVHDGGWPDDLPPRGTDYWLFDSREVFEQHYADDGTWLGSTQVTDPARVVSACAWRDAALHLGTPWRTYIGSRPELRERLARSRSCRCPEDRKESAGVPASLNPHRVRLAGRLRALRAASGYSGNRFAQQLGWLQSRVSKIETGKQLPTEADLDAWVQATHATRDDVDELAQLLAAARVEYATWRDMSRRTPHGLADQQAAYRESEAAAQHIAEYQPAMIPGIVQTPAYARELLLLPGGPTSQGMSAADVEAVVAERVRRQEILYQPGRLIQIVVGEAALYNAPGATETMRGQLDRLITIAGLATVDLRVIPHETAMPVMPIGGFSLEDDTVYYESLTGEHRLHEPEEVAVYRQAFEALLAATERQDSVEHVRWAIEELGKRA